MLEFSPFYNNLNWFEIHYHMVIKVKNIIVLLAVISPLILFSGCSKDAGPIQGEITFITGTVKINNIDAAVGGKVSKDDILQTGIRSEAVIQITETAVITLRSETEMKFDALLRNKDKTDTINLKLDKGASFHKIMKKGTDYSVTAPTAVASVRGTSFEFDLSESKTLITVDTGTVYVRIVPGKGTWENILTENQNNGIDDVVLTAGQSLELASNGTSGKSHSAYNKSITENLSRDLTSEKTSENIKKSNSIKPGKAKTNKTEIVKNKKAAKKIEKKELAQNKKSDKKTDNVKPAENIKSIGSTDKTELPQNNKTDGKTEEIILAENNKTAAKKTDETLSNTAEEKKIISSSDKTEKAPDPVEVKKLLNKKNRKLDDIKKVYNRIDRIYLYSGKIITGAIIERGDVYSIMLTDGIIKVSRKDIQSNEIIR